VAGILADLGTGVFLLLPVQVAQVELSFVAAKVRTIANAFCPFVTRYRQAEQEQACKNKFGHI